MRIGIVTFFGPYGGALQCYALQCVLRSMGHDVTVINRRWGRFGTRKKISFFSLIKQRIHETLVGDPYSKFYQQNYHFTRPVTSPEDLQELGTEKHFDVIIAGSDQPWNPECIKTMDYYFYLDWVSPNVKKYAYAVSFGKDYFPASKDEIKKIKDLLQTYEAISVREKSGIDICKNLFDINAIQCLDPTLLLQGKDYSDIIDGKNLKSDYICEFFLDPTPDKLHLVHEIAAQEGLSVVDNNPPYPTNRFARYFFRKYSISQWLRNIRDAKYVITDSFHGTVFSILFHKHFVSIDNIKRGSARFRSLLSLVGLCNHLLNEKSMNASFVYKLLKEDIDYKKIDGKLVEARAKSITFVKRIS